MVPIPLDDLTDDELKTQYREVREEYMRFGSTLTGGNAGDGGFSRSPDQRADLWNRLMMYFHEMKRRNLTALPLPTSRTTVVFRD